MKLEHPNYGKAQNMSYEDWWHQLIMKVYDPIKVQQPFIDEVITTFESSKGYSSYDDVLRFLNTNYGPDVIFIAASNGDPRVSKVMESLDMLKYFHKVYLSYDIELSKPSIEFFNYIIDDLLQHVESLKGLKKTEVLKNTWHIGDELVNDLEGSVKAGWNGILIDRKNEYESLIDKVGEADLAKIKINTDFSNTVNHEFDDDSILKLDDKRYIAKNFNQVSNIIRLNSRSL